MTYYPFLKWAGGKRWLSPYAHALAPAEFGRYFEPFLGAGAFFGALEPPAAMLSDCNAELINCFVTMRDQPDHLYSIMQRHQENHSDEYYYLIRSVSYLSALEKAGRFLYLNRTCFNGIYRVNQQGKFNVPRGTKSSVLFAHDDFSKASRLLASARIEVCDFESTISAAGEGDFVFCDPPYTVSHNNNGFVRYNEKMFSWSDQIRLRDCLKAANERGVRFLVTNAAHYSIRDIYQSPGFFINPVSRASVIGGGNQYRGRYSEFLISNYQPDFFGSARDLPKARAAQRLN
ncbi:Dam family site-specific DNA-(adenine-N6)-methyltransferase [Caulobacter sp. SLTY]|uniref:DNA adenine methylase n=1 Tax=Caulobacter sp. SLTY TaxID=2683262 RepID=UPI001412379E|nr:Dam family site-specific DNA-(adenine-N6)-methyltransferase [Caulobacter sp. SLTY]NBB17372.1 Dam family site-specific DNA-(adenine-N6)-methyltransferase [Caulobacter sp. SLTY]